jgi:hypothetical protein
MSSEVEDSYAAAHAKQQLLAFQALQQHIDRLTAEQENRAEPLLRHAQGRLWRKQVLLDEANAIGTAYLRAGMLPDRRQEVRALLREYVDTRLQAVQTGKIADGIRRSEQLQDQLWAQAVSLGERNPASIVVGLFVESLNEVIDIHAKRVTVAVRNRIPGAIWLALLSVAVIALAAMGYHVGIAGTARSIAQVAVALTFSVVIGLIADLDRPQEGTLTVSQQALVDLRQSMQTPRPP